MSEDDRTILAGMRATMEAVLKRLDEIRADNQYCRTHCDSAMSGVFRRLSAVELISHGAQASKLNPHWIVAAAEWAGIVVLIYLGLHK